ncbi:Na+/H+ antiporter subunit D [Martelella mediterranea]|uniref:Na+/H+ antiporter subunit D n=1 Tax=Martelella mediterranea TaxID=293089 RepID=UPI001E577E0D|nr:Na+/H+ antiporter subunit D [Martelella mediterranea]MCD1632983.1 Na+/H+ antiporter subunit D [Martelella mediterranea]
MAASAYQIDPSAALTMAPTSLTDWLVILPVATCIAVGALLLMIRKHTVWHPVIAIAALAFLVVIDSLLLYTVWENGPLTMVAGRWLPPFGIAFTADIMSALFALAAAIAGLAGAVFALGSIDASGRRYGFYPFLLLLIAGVSGAFLTGDIFNLYVWFEVLLISSFGLLILGSTHEQLDGAMKYAVLNLIGTTLFLIAVAYTYAVFGTLNMADIAIRARETPTLPTATIGALFVLAFGMKAAAFPVNFWLPASYHTPRTVVSALFGGLLTKVGVYALLRVMVMILPADLASLSSVVGLAAFLTMVLAGLGAIAQHDIRRAVGYIVIVGIGNCLAGVAIGGMDGLQGALFYALHSMILMTLLYLITGLAGRLAGGFSLNQIGGIYKRYPVFAGLSLGAFFAAAGLPPFSGFWPKAILVRAGVETGSWWLAAGILFAGFCSTIALGRIFLLAYWRPAEGEVSETLRIPFSEWLPIIGLSAIIVVFGLYPEPVLDLTAKAIGGILSPEGYFLSVFPGGSVQ